MSSYLQADDVGLCGSDTTRYGSSFYSTHFYEKLTNGHQEYSFSKCKTQRATRMKRDGYGDAYGVFHDLKLIFVPINMNKHWVRIPITLGITLFAIQFYLSRCEHLSAFKLPREPACMQRLAVIEMNWHNTKRAEIKLVDSIMPDATSPEVATIFDNLMKYVGQQWLLENEGDDAAEAYDCMKLPQKLQV